MSDTRWLDTVVCRAEAHRENGSSPSGIDTCAQQDCRSDIQHDRGAITFQIPWQVASVLGHERRTEPKLQVFSVRKSCSRTWFRD
jgi:hypothetical protein